MKEIEPHYEVIVEKYDPIPDISIMQLSQCVFL